MQIDIHKPTLILYNPPHPNNHLNWLNNSKQLYQIFKFKKHNYKTNFGNGYWKKLYKIFFEMLFPNENVFSGNHFRKLPLIINTTFLFSEGNHHRWEATIVVATLICLHTDHMLLLNLRNMRSLTQKSLLTSDIFDLWRLPKHRRRIGWRQNNVGKIADVTWRRSFWESDVIQRRGQ